MITASNTPHRLELFRRLRDGYKQTMFDLSEKAKQEAANITQLEAQLDKARRDLHNYHAEIVSTKGQFTGVTAIIREMEDAQREQERLAEETKARLAREAEDTELGEL